MLVQNGHIAGLFDAEHAIWGDPLMEHNLGCYGSEPYRAAYDYDFAWPDVIERRKLYDLHHSLVMRIETEYRGFDDAHRQWTTRNLIDRLAALAARMR